jgi:hypothetical protein
MNAFGVEHDEDANQAAKRACGISALGSAVKVPVIPANEESIVARETAAAGEKAVQWSVFSDQWSENGYGERNKFGFL